MTTPSQKTAAWLCLLVACADFAQPLLLDWRPKFVGALLGGALYLAASLSMGRGVRLLAYVVAVMPLVPVTVLSLFALGVPLPVAPDVAMVVVLVGQLGAAAACISWLRAGRAGSLGIDSRAGPR